MTERGNVSVDERTNTLLVRDTQEALNAIRGLVNELDIPVRQVLIESRIVLADDSFNRDLGVRFGLSKNAEGSNGDTFALGGGLAGTTDYGDTVTFNTGGNENFIVDLPIGGPAASLQMEIQAAQQEGRGEVMSNPRVVTSNQKEAVIEQGVEIPYQEASSSGATSTSFKSAVLSLRVTPQITPDDRTTVPPWSWAASSSSSSARIPRRCLSSATCPTWASCSGPALWWTGNPSCSSSSRRGSSRNSSPAAEPRHERSGVGPVRTHRTGLFLGGSDKSR